MNVSDIFTAASYFGGYYIFLAVFAVILILAAIVGGILLRCLLFTKKNDGKFKGFMGWVYDLFNFKTLIIKPIILLFYCINACLIVAISLIQIFCGGIAILTGLLTLVVGEIIVRLLYELAMLSVLTVTNLMEINKKLGGKASDMVISTDLPDFTPDKKEAAPVVTPVAPVAEPEVFTIPEPVDNDNQ